MSVLSPALGGLIIGHEVARASGVLALFAERRNDVLTLRRGFSLDRGERVLIVEDVGLCEKVQRGLHSRGYTQGRFVVDRSSPEYSEHHVHFFQKMVRDALLDPAESDHA